MKPKYNTAKFRSQTLGASLVTSIIVCLSGSAFAADNFWLGTTSTDWNDATNWSLGTVPLGPDDAVINVKTPNIATITANPTSTPRDFRVGQNAGADGQLNLISGSATTGGGNWAFIGRNGGTGVFNLADTTGGGGASTGFAQGSGNFTCNGSRLYVGGGNDGATGGTGTFNMNTSGTLAIGSDLAIGVSTGAIGVMNVDNGTITTQGWNFIGKNENGEGGNGTLKMTGGLLTNTGITYVGQQGCVGTMILSGGTYKHLNNEVFMVGGTINWADWFGTIGGTGFLTVDHSASLLDCPGEFWIGNRGGTGTMTLSAGTVTTNNWTVIGRNTGSTGTLTMTGGTFNKNGGGQFIVGDWGNATATQSGGALNINGELWVGQGGTSNSSYTMSGGTIAVNSWVAVGRDGGTGLFSMTGGTLTKTGGGSAFIIGASGPGTLNQSGGLVDVQGGDTWMGENNLCNYTLSGSGEFRAGYFQVARGGSSTANVNLDGGTLRANQIVGGDGAENVHFNGTQIIAKTNQANFIANMSSAAVDAGGLKIDNAGFTLVVPQVLSGTGGLVKSGAGTLTLSAVNSYSGGNTVNAGELSLKAANSGGGDLILANGTTLSVAAQFAGAQLPHVNGSFGTSDTLNLNLGDVGGLNPSSAILAFSGNLVLAGDVNVNVSGSKFQAASMPLVSYVPGQKSGAGNFVITGLPAGVVGNLVDDTVNGLIYLNITSVALPEWDGTNVPKYVKTGDVTTGSANVAVTDASNIVAGQKVFGAGIPTGTTVSSVDVPNLIVTLSQAATADAFATPVIFTIGTGSNDGVWDINTTQNWVDQVTTNLSVYKDPNPVLFSDRATGPTAVVLDSTVTPTEVVFNNSSLIYSLTGTGKVSGASSFTKSGTAALTVNTTNDYTGVTTLSGGDTNVATLTNGGFASPLGAASSAASNLVLSGGTLNYTGATVSTDRGFSTGGLDGAIAVPSGSDLTVSGPVTGGLISSFNKKGDGSLILTNSAVTIGGTGQVNEVLAGSLKLIGPGQTVSVPGELWVGSVPAAAGHLVLDSSSLTVGSWMTLGRGNGNTGLLSTVSATNSTVATGNFSTGYNNNLPNDSDQTVTLTNTTWSCGGQTLLGESENSTTTLTIDATSTYNANGVFLTALGNGSVANIIVQGTLNHTAGHMSVGNSGTGVGTMTVTGIVNSSGDFNVGDIDSSNGTLNVQTTGSVVSTGNVYIGKNGTTGVVNLSGASTMTSPETNVGGNTGSNGALNIAGTSVYTSNNRLQVGPGGGSTGSVLIEGSGILTVNSYVSVGYNGGGSMTVKDSASFSNTDDFSVNESGDVPATLTLQDNATMTIAKTTFVGRNAGRVGTVTQTGGTYTGNGGEFQIGVSGTGTWLQSGGTTNAGGWVAVGRHSGSTGVLTVSGTGTFNQTGAGNALIVGEVGTGTLNIHGTGTVSSVASNGVMVANNSGANGTVNLGNGTPGGTLIAKKVVEGAGGNSTFNFNGGVLKAATGADLNFMAGIDAANVNPGGAFIDSNGETIAINLSLNDGNGNLTKQGAGTLLLNGANTYIGTTTVTAGTLGGTGSVGGELIVPAGSSIAPGASAVGTFTVEDTFGNGSVIAGTYVCEVDGANADKLAVGGALNVTGATLDFSTLSAPTAPSYVIATFGSITGTFTEQNVPAGYDVVYSATDITLVQTATPYSTWAGTFGLDPLTDGAPGVDKDNDGQSNGIEFALGGSPISGSDNAKIFNLAADSDADVDATNELLLTIAVRSGTPAFIGSPAPTATKDGFTYTIEGSTTLSSFTTAATPVTTVAPPAPNATPPAGYEYRTFSLSGSNGLTNKGFLRVKVTN